MQNHSEINSIIELLNELIEDPSISKGLKKSIENVILILKGTDDIKILCNKAQQALEGICDDGSVDDPYMRTQIWNIVSMLENASNTSKSTQKKK